MNLNFPEKIRYSEKYLDSKYEYRNITLTRAIYEIMPKSQLLSEYEWISLGIKQSRGWVHYGIHKTEPHILMFRRPLTLETFLISFNK